MQWQTLELSNEHGQWSTKHNTENKLEKKYAPTLDNYGQSCFVRSDFFKMKCVCKTQMMPPPDNKKEMKSCHYQIFDENQNPVDMHTSIMCINIIQNIKAVAPKL